MSTYEKKLKETRISLDAVSPAMCVAKWLQTTIHLHTGKTHSCHHTPLSTISLEDVKANLHAIHNTKEKRVERIRMLSGEKPEGCNYCWVTEANGGTPDRVYKSAEDWAYPRLEEVIQSGDGERINPAYLEVSFESTCNFMCTYCKPEISSKVWEESRRYGALKLKSVTHNSLEGVAPPSRGGPMVDAFWRALPEWWDGLKVLRVTGGEPLLSDETWRLFDYAKENRKVDMTLALNTNLGVPERLFDRMIQSVQALEKHSMPVQLFTSLEATGIQAEYIRWGLDYDQFVKRIYRVLEETNMPVTFMTTIGILSYSTFDSFLGLTAEIMSKHPERLRLSTNFLRAPVFFDLRLLTDQQKENFRRMVEAVDKRLFSMKAKEQLESLLRWAEGTAPNAVILRQDLISWCRENDRRRGSNFQEVFPWLNELNA